ncbi:MAG: hypothetical protein ACO3S5_11720 [Ilumatobacteraceae bacterium]
MPAPTTTVTAFLELSATGGDFFILDDPTKGELDNATFTLAGVVGLPTDITDRVNRVSITRGASSPLFSARTPPAARWSVQLNNEDRQFDPSFPFGFGSNVVPGRRIKVQSNGITIVDGQVEDWNYEYQPSGRSVAVIDASDSLASLAAIELDAFTATASQLPGARINAVLNRSEVAFTHNRNIDTGISTLQGDTVADGTNVLAYLQTVARSDYGTLFAGRDGRVTFKDRHSNAGLTALLFDDTGTGIGFQAIELQYGSELLYNRVVIERVGGTAQTKDDTTSQAAYRIRTLSQSGLLLSSDQLAEDLADFLVSTLAEPRIRVTSLTVELAALSQAQQDQVLALDLTSPVDVTFTPNGVGEPTFLVAENDDDLVTEGGVDLAADTADLPAPITRNCVVEGISHSISAGGTTHVVTLSLGDALFTSLFVLDDAEFGVLGDDVLAF